MKGFPFRQFFDIHVRGKKNQYNKNNQDKDLKK
jgi:hypothetical protein